MQSFEKRIATLEQSVVQEEMVMFIILVGMGEVGKEINRIHDNYGNEWSRRPSEPEDVFKERATSETPRNEYQVAMLFAEIPGR